jgi:hypothetical protein
MTAIAPFGVGHRLEYISECSPDPIPTGEPTAIGFGSARGLEHAIVCEQTHQSFNVMAVPGVGVFDEQTFQIVAVHVKPPGVGISSS